VYIKAALKVSLFIERRSIWFVYLSYEYTFELTFYCKVHLLSGWDMNGKLRGKTV